MSSHSKKQLSPSFLLYPTGKKRTNTIKSPLQKGDGYQKMLRDRGESTTKNDANSLPKSSSSNVLCSSLICWPYLILINAFFLLCRLDLWPHQKIWLFFLCMWFALHGGNPLITCPALYWKEKDSNRKKHWKWKSIKQFTEMFFKGNVFSSICFLKYQTIYLMGPNGLKSTMVDTE